MRDSDFDSADMPDFPDPNNSQTGQAGILALMRHSGGLYRRIDVIAKAYGLRVDQFAPSLDAGAAADAAGQGFLIVLSPNWVEPQQVENS